MDQKEYDRIYARWEALKAERQSYWSHWKDINDFLLPRSGRFFLTDKDRGNKRHGKIMNNTATRALRTLASGMMSGMTSPARPWFRMQTTNPDLQSSREVRVWCDRVTKLMHQIYQSSNSYLTLHSVYEELGAYGTAADIVVADYQNVIHHYPLTIGEYAIATNWQGQADTLYREFRRSVGQVVREFGIENVSMSVKRLFDEGKLDEMITLLHCIEPREDYDSSKRDSKNMPWKSVYLECGGKKEKPLRETGFKSFPALAPRWGAVSGETYGSSPAMDALGDIMQLQHAELRMAEGLDFQTRPPLQAPSELKDQLDNALLPGGMVYVSQVGNQNAVQPIYQPQSDYSGTQLKAKECEGRINAAFYADLFLMISGANVQGMTATEVAERHEEKLLALGPILERLQHELLNPLIDLTFQRIVGAGLLPPPPADLQGQAVNVELVSMLAQAQKAVANNATDRFIAAAMNLGSAKIETLDRIDVDYWADTYPDLLGVDPALIVPLEVAQQNREARAQANAVQAQASMQAQAAKTAVDVAKANAAQPNNPTAQFSGYTGA